MVLSAFVSYGSFYIEYLDVFRPTVYVCGTEWILVFYSLFIAIWMWNDKWMYEEGNQFITNSLHNTLVREKTYPYIHLIHFFCYCHIYHPYFNSRHTPVAFSLYQSHSSVWKMAETWVFLCENSFFKLLLLAYMLWKALLWWSLL